MKVRITSCPPGGAPEKIRRCWIGLELEVIGPGGGLCEEVGSREKIVSHGLVVWAMYAIDQLASKHPEAAEWWKTETPYYVLDCTFVFDPKCCTVVA